MKSAKVWLSFAVCFMLFIFAPLEMLFMNQDEFWFDAYLLLSIMIFVFAVPCVCSIVAFVVLEKWSKKVYGVCLAVYFAAFVSLYIQGNYMTGNLPLLDGLPIDWSLYKAEYVQSYVLWIAVAAAVAVIYHKTKGVLFEKIVGVVSICMTLMFVVTLTALAATHHGFEKKPGLVVTYKNILQLSADQNLIVLLLDAVDAETMSELLAQDPEYQDIFEDFTYYSNMMGAYPATRNSIPFILSGKWFENEVEFREYEAAAYAESPLLANLEGGGWQIGLYEAELLANDEGKQRFENVLPSKRGINHKLMMIKYEVQLTGFRYAPYCLKPHTFVNLKDFNTMKIPPEGETAYSMDNGDFYRLLLNEGISLTDRECFRFIHINGAHAPFTWNEKMEEVDPADGSYEDNVRASLTITKTYLDKLKDAGVYDNSAIIVMADHGYSHIVGDYHGQQDPIFFVKGVDERHDLAVSDAPVSYEDLQEAFARLIEGNGSDEIFDWKSGDKRERRYLFYESGRLAYSMTEQIQTGQASDLDTMYETGKVYER